MVHAEQNSHLIAVKYKTIKSRNVYVSILYL